MTQVEMLNKLKIMSGETDNGILTTYLSIAEEKVYRRRYPYDNGEVKPLPSQYQGVILNVATYLINKRGAEGELSHSENGISRSYESADVPSAMLKDVTPCCEVF